MTHDPWKLVIFFITVSDESEGALLNHTNGLQGGPYIYGAQKKNIQSNVGLEGLV